MKYLRTLEDWFDKLNDDGDFPKLLEVGSTVDVAVMPPLADNPSNLTLRPWFWLQAMNVSIA